MLLLLQCLLVEYNHNYVVCSVYSLTALGMCICCPCKLYMAELMAGALFGTSEGKSVLLQGLPCQLPPQVEHAS